MAAMIHRVPGGFVISEDQVWRPGSYDTREAAECALRLPDELLRRLQDEVAPDRMTLDMLKQAMESLG